MFEEGRGPPRAPQGGPGHAASPECAGPMLPDHVPRGLLQHRVLDDVAAVRRPAVRAVRRAGHHDLAGGTVPGPADRGRLHVPAGASPGGVAGQAPSPTGPRWVSATPTPDPAPHPAPASPGRRPGQDSPGPGPSGPAGAPAWRSVSAPRCAGHTSQVGPLRPKDAVCWVTQGHAVGSEATFCFVALGDPLTIP